MTCDLMLNPLYFVVVHDVNGQTSPAYQVYPGITTLSPFNLSPFNSERTPFLLPAAVERFGFNAQADSAPGRLLAFDDTGFQNPPIEKSLTNNVLNFWVMRCGA